METTINYQLTGPNSIKIGDTVSDVLDQMQPIRGKTVLITDKAQTFDDLRVHHDYCILVSEQPETVPQCVTVVSMKDLRGLLWNIL